MISRVGIMGGMFDPVHNGHMEVALSALNLLKLDQLRMVPCGRPNHREEALCSAQQRLHMMRLVTRHDKKLITDSREVDRPGISYAYDTLLSLRQEDGDAILVFILGVDAFNTLHQWYRWQDLFGLCHFLVINRPGSVVDPLAVMGKELEKRQVYSVNELFNQAAGSILVLENLNIDISSSQVRHRISENKPLDDFISPEVARYLIEHDLYTGKTNTTQSASSRKTKID